MSSSEPVSAAAVRSPRVVIEFCTQCKWLLRAAYYAQELLSTFGTALGEVALQPATGGIFRVHLQTAAGDGDATTTTTTTLWDRKIDGGFPETKELKRRVRDVVEPGRDLGHVDRKKEKKTEAKEEEGAEATKTTTATATSTTASTTATVATAPSGPVCEDCQ